MSGLRHRLFPVAVLILILVLGAGLTFSVARLEEKAIAGRLDRTADLVAFQINARISQHMALLRATNSYFESPSGKISAADFGHYVETLGLSDRYRGIQGIGFARLIGPDQTGLIHDELLLNYGIEADVRPPMTGTQATPIVLLAPQDVRNQAALGYDMFSEPARRAAIEGAMATGEMQATAPVLLVQEITPDKQPGFLVYQPARLKAEADGSGAGSGEIAGFVYAPFRSVDFHQAALEGYPDLPVRVQTVDEAARDVVLFDSHPEVGVTAPRVTRREVPFAGRVWEVTVSAMPGFAEPGDKLLAKVVGLLSALLALASAAAVYGYQTQLTAAAEAARLSDRLARNRTLMLQEMKHRIKNHIARIQAIARHTKRHADDLEDFDRQFSGRLMSMASAQDLLTAEGGGSADLRDLIRREMAQVMASDHADAALNGPELRLNEAQVRAMSLVIHELTTNAMKYGSAATGGPDIAVTWAEAAGELVLDWRETGARLAGAGGKGFGTELIEALIEGDLAGHVERQFDDVGMRVTIRFPR